MLYEPDMDGGVAEHISAAAALGRPDPARHAHRGIQRETAVLPGEHLADILRLDQAAAYEPAQHPHANLLGDGGHGLRCQVSGGAKAHGLRDIIGILDRFEDSVDDAGSGADFALVVSPTTSSYAPADSTVSQ